MSGTSADSACLKTPAWWLMDERSFVTDFKLSSSFYCSVSKLWTNASAGNCTQDLLYVKQTLYHWLAQPTEQNTTSTRRGNGSARVNSFRQSACSTQTTLWNRQSWHYPWILNFYEFFEFSRSYLPNWGQLAICHESWVVIYTPEWRISIEIKRGI